MKKNHWFEREEQMNMPLLPFIAYALKLLGDKIDISSA